MQSVIQISADRENPAAIKLTTARYFTPSGRSIQAKGITPDLLVEDTSEGNFAGWNVREADLANHLVNTTVPPEPENKAANKPSAKGAAKPDKNGGEPGSDHAPIAARRYEFGSADDYQLKQAMNFLMGAPVETAKTHDKIAATEEPKKETPKTEAKH